MSLVTPGQEELITLLISLGFLWHLEIKWDLTKGNGIAVKLVFYHLQWSAGR